MSNLTWLTVGGCPRSGTTALGEVLNRHPEVALFHEYDQAHLFATVAALFREEDRLGAYGETASFDLVPRRARHELLIIQSIFEQVAGKRASVLGTKFPGAHLWPAPVVPAGMAWKHLHITRAPHAVVASYAKKMLREGYPGGHAYILDTAIAHWVSAWNHAVEHHDDPNFLHLVYEDLAGDLSLAERLAGFLGLADAHAFDFSDFCPTNKTPAEYRADLEMMGFGDMLGRLDALAGCYPWPEFVRSGAPLGFPLAAGETVVLAARAEANGWKYSAAGFYPAEPEGCWVGRETAELRVIPQFDAPQARLSLDVPWTFEPGGQPPVLAVEVDDRNVLVTPVALGAAQGRPRRFAWNPLDLDLRAGQSATLRLRVLNPRNPKTLGYSQDDRDLGLMVRSLRIDPL